MAWVNQSGTLKGPSGAKGDKGDTGAAGTNGIVPNVDWTPVTLDAGFTGGNPQWTSEGRVYEFQGSTVAGSFPVGSTDIGTLPVAARPPHTKRGICWLTGGKPGIIGLAANGIITVMNPGAATATSLQFSVQWIK